MKRLQAWDTLQDSTDDSNTDKVETILERQEHFSQFEGTTDTLPCRIQLPACLCIKDPPSRTSMNISHGNDMLPQDTTHLLQRSRYQRGSPCKNQEAIGPHEDLLTIVKRHKLKWYRQSPVCQRHKLKWYRQSPVYQVWPKPSCKAQWK